LGLGVGRALGFSSSTCWAYVLTSIEAR
jgi:hypothetical protein